MVIISRRCPCFEAGNLQDGWPPWLGYRADPMPHRIMQSHPFSSISVGRGQAAVDELYEPFALCRKAIHRNCSGRLEAVAERYAITLGKRTD